MPTESFHDQPVLPAEADGLPERFFDRFMFNMHAVDGSPPEIIVGCGLYPPRDVADGFVLLATETEQRSLVHSTELSDTDWRSAGPFSFECVTENQEWRLRLGPNETGLEMDATWRARAPYSWSRVDVDNASDEATSFDHLVQSGHYSGTITIHGQQRSIDGWYGQRDRSRGVRTMQGGQGLHIWYQAQFPDRCVGFLLVESRTGERMLLEGAVMHTDGEVDDIVDVTHDLIFDDGLDLRSGTVLVQTRAGRSYRIHADASARGLYLAGAGYGGHHGKARGRDFREASVWPLDGSVTPRQLDSSLTDRLATFDWEGTAGSGIFEFALSRSNSYTYRPSL
ncbi:MAG: hypothetical protein V9G19_20510 [Tetrasphaera sp.]